MPRSKEANKALDLELGFHFEVIQSERNRYIASYKSIGTWYEGFSADSVRGTDASFLARLDYVIRFCRDIGQDPDTIISNRKQEIRDENLEVREKCESMVRKHFTRVYKNRTSSKPVTAAYCCVQSLKSFFLHNRVSLKMKTPRRVLAKPRRVITISEARKMYRIADVRERVLIKIQIHGYRPETILKMKYGLIRTAIESKEYPALVSLSAMSLKGAYSPYISFLDKETCEEIALYMELRKNGTNKIEPETITDSSPLIRARYKETHLKYSNYRLIFKKLIQQANLDNSLTPYAFRRFFQTTAEAAGVPPNWVDYLMFHIPRGSDASSYSMPSPEQLKAAFMKVQPFLAMKESDDNKTFVKKELLNSFAQFAGVNLDATIKKTSIKSIEDMDENEIASLFEEFRKELFEKRLTPEAHLKEQVEMQNLEKMPVTIKKKDTYLIVTGKVALLDKLNEGGYEYIREMANEEYLIKKLLLPS